MAYSINALTAPDAYTAASTIAPGVPLKRSILDVANQAIFWQIAYRQGAGAVWEGTEQRMDPGSRAVLEPHIGIRVRAAIPAASLPAGASQAVVTVRAIE